MRNKCKYPKLDGLITEKFGTRKAFAEAVNMSENTLSNKMSGKRKWNQKDQEKACDALQINPAEAGIYFLL